MPAVRMYIASFGRAVLIDHDHPLAIAQRALDSAAKAAKRSEAVDNESQDGALGAALVPLASSGELVQSGHHPVEPPPPAPIVHVGRDILVVAPTADPKARRKRTKGGAE